MGSFRKFLQERDTSVPAKKESKGYDPYNSDRGSKAPVKRIPLRQRAMKLAHKSRNGVDPYNSSNAYAEKFKQVKRDNPGVKEETEALNEMMPLKGHPWHEKPSSHLHYIIKDAHAAAQAVQNHDTKAHHKYLDQINDASTILAYRAKAAMGGHPVREEVEPIEERIANNAAALEKAKVKAALRVKNAQDLNDKAKAVSLLQQIKKMIRALKGKKKVSAKEVKAYGVSVKEETTPTERKDQRRFKFDRKRKGKEKERQNEEFDIIYESGETIGSVNEEMSHAAHELVLHADNDSHLHHSSHMPIINNLKKKAKKGVYDSEKAKKLWSYHADRAAQSYHKQHGTPSQPWHKMFTTHDRHQAAHHWEVHHRDEVHE